VSRRAFSVRLALREKERPDPRGPKVKLEHAQRDSGRLKTSVTHRTITCQTCPEQRRQATGRSVGRRSRGISFAINRGRRWAQGGGSPSVDTELSVRLAWAAPPVRSLPTQQSCLALPLPKRLGLCSDCRHEHYLCRRYRSKPPSGTATTRRRPCPRGLHPPATSRRSAQPNARRTGDCLQARYGRTDDR
jgi:hypothetical protein